MGKIIKKGTTGNAAQYLTRNQALKKLQLKLSQFRRLCILKGIHPREPKKKPAGLHKTYYHVKDIAYLLHEPILKALREQHAYQKKLRKAKARRNRELLERLQNRAPSYRLDHLVKERYPSFIDAVRDLDDPLTLTHLFAVLPAESAYSIPTNLVATARRLALEWQAYIVRTAALRKVFVSVKGYYFQADVAGQPVTWLVPHATSQVLPPDVDYRVMLTFLEFYETLLGFVLFKLYHAHGLTYPPVLDERLEQAAAGLEAIMRDLAQPQRQLEGAGSDAQQQQLQPAEPDAKTVARLAAVTARLRSLQQQKAGAGVAVEQEGEHAAGAGSDSDSDSDAAASRHDSSDEGEGEGRGVAESPGTPGRSDSGGAVVAGGAAEVDPSDDAAICARLFSGFTFFLGREVPREQLMFVARAFGGAVGWEGEGSPITVDDERITHQLVDRPTLATARRPGREYVQPQWLFDSANFRVLVPTDLYAPGASPPPHLSPFANDEEEGYVPDYGHQLRALQAAATAARQRAAGGSGGGEEGGFVGDAAAGGAAGVRSAHGAVGDVAAAEARYAADLARELKAASGVLAAEELDDPEAGGAALKAPASVDKQEVEEGEDEASARMAVGLLSRKKRRLVESVAHKEAIKQAKVAKLKKRKAALVGGQ